MQQFYKNVVDSKVFDTKWSFLSRNRVSLLRNAFTKSEVFFSVEIIEFNIYIKKACVETSKRFRDRLVIICI